MTSRPPQTGWVISQDLQVVSGSANNFDAAAMTKLFKIHGRENGEWEQRNLKVSIEDIAASTDQQTEFGTFTVTVRMASDKDNAPEVVQRFTGCNLNPASDNYIAKKIGDKYLTWSDTDRRFTEIGQFDNQSAWIRVEMNPQVDAGVTEASLLPYGVFGPIRHKGFSFSSGSTTISAFGDIATSFTGSHIRHAATPIVRPTQTVEAMDVGGVAFTGSFRFPSIALRSSTTAGNLASPKQAYFGIQTDKVAGEKFDRGYVDMVRAMPSGYSSFSVSSDITEYSWIFTLDDISGTVGQAHASWVSGSRASGSSFTAVYGDFKKVLEQGFNRFTMPLVGGFDGLDITEREPFRNSFLTNGTDTTNYAFNSIKRAIDSVADEEEYDASVMVAPGITNQVLTSHLVNVCEDRSDAIGIIDLPGDYTPDTENTATEANRLGDITTTINNLIRS